MTPPLHRLISAVKTDTTSLFAHCLVTSSKKRGECTVRRRTTRPSPGGRDYRPIRNENVGQGDNSVHDNVLHTWVGNSQNGDVTEINDNNGGINARFGLRGNGVYGITG